VLPRRFTDLSAFGRGIIATVAVITLAITGVAFAASYNALYRLFDSLGLYGEWITLAIPLLLDAAFIGGELAAILAGMLRAITGDPKVHKGWPATVVLICGALTIALNVVHAYLLDPHAGPLTFWRCLAASLPPALMILAFQVDVAIVRWVMIALGKPLHGAETSVAFLGTPAWQAQVPGSWPGYGPGAFPPQPAVGQMPSAAAPANGQNGHPSTPELSQRGVVEMYLSGLDPVTLGVTTGSSIVAALAPLGVRVDERHARRILEEWKHSHAGSEQR
jgi:hypothetical protein